VFVKLCLFLIFFCFCFKKDNSLWVVVPSTIQDG